MIYYVAVSHLGFEGTRTSFLRIRGARVVRRTCDMTRAFSQIESMSLSDEIARQIEDAIMSGQVRLGETINTDALARQFKVSHIPVREALKILEAVGLIV